VTDRMVSVNEADLRAAVGRGRGIGGTYVTAINHLCAALDALGPEPCGPELCDHPSKPWHHIGEGPDFRCVAPEGHHAYVGGRSSHCRLCDDDPARPIHCGDAHVPPADVWAET